MGGSAYFKWKEEMVYEDELGRILVFEAPMGVTPCDVFVPSSDTWSSKAPPWAREKRDEVLRAIRAVSGVRDVIEEPNAWVEERIA